MRESRPRRKCTASFSLLNVSSFSIDCAEGVNYDADLRAVRPKSYLFVARIYSACVGQTSSTDIASKSALVAI